jgi:glucose/arabinose dehydrogenase/mono/diheme cytochrome c family protein
MQAVRGLVRSALPSLSAVATIAALAALAALVPPVAAAPATGAPAGTAAPIAPAAGAPAAGCPKDDSGLTLPAGFCATVFADGTGHARHLFVSPDGVVYVNTWSGRYYAKDGRPEDPDRGFLLALKDTHGTGRADVIRHFGESPRSGGAGGTGIALYGGFLYAEINDRIVRYPLPRGSIVPKGRPQTVVAGLPLGGDHPMHPFAIDAGGSLYVDVASATNSCQLKNRTLKSPGLDPCVELETRGGIWRFDAHKLNQRFSPAQRFATGIRNGEGFAIDGAGRVYVTQHGRDQLHANWPDLYQPEEEATLPAEEVLLLAQDADFGWPECYFDPAQNKLVLAPEYGGDGGRTVGPCAAKTGPVAAYPAHWAPNDLLFYGQRSFPARYRNGLFIAFHGSWDRAPYGQQGYNVVFQPLSTDKAARPGPAGGGCEIFADGFAGPSKTPGTALHRPSGLALGPDESLYVSDDVRGRIYRIVYSAHGADASGAAAVGSAAVTACPDAAAAAGPISALNEQPPEGTNPDAGAPLPVPPGASAEMVALGNRIFHGEVGGAACTGCHGADGAGTPLGPNLTDEEWLWSDGSVDGIASTITQGVMQPKQYRAPMPPLGGAQLSPAEVKALAAYVWALSHRK